MAATSRHNLLVAASSRIEAQAGNPNHDALIAAGGGVTTLEQMHRLVRNGADKVIINSAAIDNPHLLEEGASHFGAQAMLASIDVRSKPDGRPRRRPTPVSASATASNALVARP